MNKSRIPFIFLILLVIPFVYAEDTFPRVQIVSPLDYNTWRNTNTTIEINYYLYDNIEFSRCELWSDISGNWAFNKTNSTGLTNNYLNILNFPVWADTSYKNYNLKCFDNTTNKQYAWANKTGIFEDFNYSAGLLNNTTPRLVAQYNQPLWVNITDWKTLRVNAYTEYQGDRDMHVALNDSNIPTTTRDLVIEFTYNISDCNSSFKAIQGINPIGAAAYLNYKDGNNFLDVEFKVNSSNIVCTGGVSQISANKRINGNTFALLPFTQVALVLNRSYNARIELVLVNSTTYNMTIWHNNTIVGSSINISRSEVQDGQTLIEAAGTITEFDNLTVQDISSYRFNVYEIRECTDGEEIGNFFIGLFFIIAVMAAAFYYLYSLEGWERLKSLTVGQIVLMAITIIVGAILANALGGIIFNNCS